jgi:hypothetical protein
MDKIIDKKKIDSICIYLLNKKINKLKHNLEYINDDNSLDVYMTVESIFTDSENCPPKKLEFFYNKLKEFYGRKEKPAELLELKKAA